MHVAWTYSMIVSCALTSTVPFCNDCCFYRDSKQTNSLRFCNEATTMRFLIIAILASMVLFASAATIGSISSSTSDESLGTHRVIHREEWGGRPPLYTTPLTPPVEYVIISHSATPFETDSPNCASRVRNFQDYHVSALGSPDVGYNFIICGDGNIYVGRDWDVRNFHKDNSIGISFVGNYVYDSLTDSMIEAAQLLLESGLGKGVLSEEYKLVAHNQTYLTLSPGQNVYKVIKEWPHFYPGEVKH